LVGVLFLKIKQKEILKFLGNIFQNDIPELLLILKQKRGWRMSAYFIARVKVTDREQYKKYLKAVPAVIEKYNGKAIARSEKCISLEGPEETRRNIIIEFPSVEKAREFYNSQEYTEVKKLRANAADGEIIVVEGVK